MRSKSSRRWSGWATTQSIFHGLYGDDGEMACNICGIDFKRSSADQIDLFLNRARLFTKEEVEVAKKITESMEDKLVCEDCGKSDPSVERGYCPYASDVDNKLVPVVLCSNCYGNRSDDI